MRFVIAAHSNDPPRATIWETKASRLVPVSKYALVGWDEAIYEHTVKRLFSESISISRAIPLAMYLFSLAENTSNYVKAPITVAVVTSHSPILIEDPKAIEVFDRATEAYAKALEAMLLACADTAMSNTDFTQKFAEFSETVFTLRRFYFKAASDREAHGFLTGRWPGMPYQRVSQWTLHMLKGDGSVEAKEDREETERFNQQLKQFKETVAILGQGLAETKNLRGMKCTNSPCNRTFLGELKLAEGKLPLLEGTCPQCGKTYTIEHENLA